MKFIKKVYIIPLFILIGITLNFTTFFAQNKNSAEEYTYGSDASNKFSIEQSEYSHDSVTEGLFTHGFQKVFGISVNQGEIDNQDPLHCIVCPNPTSGSISIHIDYKDQLELIYYLYDINGRLIQSQHLNRFGTLLSLEGFASGNYIIKISNNKEMLSSFMFIKN